MLIFITVIITKAQLSLIVEEFKGNFKENYGWTIQNGQKELEKCNSQTIFGSFGSNTIVSKLFQLPKHSQINLSLDLWSPEFDGGIKVYVDQVEVHDKSEQIKCSENKNIIRKWNNTLIHSGNSVIIVLSGTGEQIDYKWGFTNLEIQVEKCQIGCQVCNYEDTFEECLLWQQFQNSWTSIQQNYLGQDGWASSSGISGTTECGGVPLIGGFNKFGQKLSLSKTIKLRPHYKIRLLVLWAKIDSWDNEKAQILFDGKEIWSKNYNINDGYINKICGNSEIQFKTQFERIDAVGDHTGDQIQITFTTTLDQNSNDESFGLRDLQLFYAPCSEDCKECSGPQFRDCTRCLYNYILQDQNCQKLQNFYILETDFHSEKFTNSFGWILQNTTVDTIISYCLDKSILGGFGILGVGASAKKQFIIPNHKRLRLQIVLYKIDSWDNEKIFILVDNVEIWSTVWNHANEANFCGQDWTDQKQYVDIIFDHTKLDTLIEISSTLNQNANDESWGFREFTLMYDLANIIQIIPTYQSITSVLTLILIFIINI
ncbi:unnamed protein product [Paramecium sonneborni]|uniref:Uncharacterized protein n=1 Tax=Paramecium sonneborni TaxID=65129 RepID=A0A8S1NRP2_9CILI|nr:unnamed protein product [Paramecium sonneborni]